MWNIGDHAQSQGRNSRSIRPSLIFFDDAIGSLEARVVGVVGLNRGCRLKNVLVSARTARFLWSLGGCLILANCSGNFARQVDPRYGVSSSPRVIADGRPIPKGGGVYRVGKPYQVAGRTYVPTHNPSYRAEGIASWYGSDFHGRLTANGEIYDKNAISAAHPTMPLPSYARVTNLANGRSLIVRVNDRGPYAKNRVIDLSARAADLLHYKGNGLAQVRVEYVGPAPIEGSDDRQLVATLRQNQPAPVPSSVLLTSNQRYAPQSWDRGRSQNAHTPPVPSERPYELGHFSSPSSPERESQSASSARVARAAPAAISSGYMSAPYASPAQGGALAFAAGRGLY